MPHSSNRRWYRFSLGTLFLVVTVFGCWLGWQMSVVRHRLVMKEFVIGHDGMVVEDDDYGVREAYRNSYPLPADVTQKSMEVPWIRRLMGDHAAAEITVPDWLDPGDKERIERAFPEAYIAEVVSEPDIEPTMSHLPK
jgi:hypothetical protein